MNIPPFLKPGDRIRIVSPAGRVVAEKILPGIGLLRDQGFEVLVGEHVFAGHFQYAGTDRQRAADFQLALNDPETKAIICARGGYGSVRILEYLDFTELKKKPKWLVGFSDITVLHSVFNKLGIAGIHGPMPGFFMQGGHCSESFRKLHDSLTGKVPAYIFDAHPQNRNGETSGILVGGNLSLLYSLNGTRYELDPKGKILFIEDISEYLYHLDRMMTNFRLSGKLEKLAGLVVGSFTKMKDNDKPFGKTVEEIILDAVRDYDFPVCFSFPSGHVNRNMPLLLGANYSLLVASSCKLEIQKNG
ncbi:MAG: LD-carboxypeptidase [Prolixibacteraceae bacterium]|jgi:muramoyltetrapeptide carboxypeptidase|nr:LD-carboxypeptidase [Prolixibacteraceae bacterium]